MNFRSVTVLSTFILELGLRRLCLVPNLYILKHAINQETMPRHAKNYTWARPMPLDKFLKVYIPESSQTRSVVPKTYFDKIRSEVANDQEIYTPFVSLNNCSVISHGLPSYLVTGRSIFYTEILQQAYRTSFLVYLLSTYPLRPHRACGNSTLM